MSDIVIELDECAKRQLAFAPEYIPRSLEYLAAREIETLRQRVAELDIAFRQCQQQHTLTIQELATLKQAQEPVAWVRYLSDECYEGPIMDSQMDDVRRQSGNWTPIFAAPKPGKTA